MVKMKRTIPWKELKQGNSTAPESTSGSVNSQSSLESKKRRKKPKQKPMPDAGPVSEQLSPQVGGMSENRTPNSGVHAGAQFEDADTECENDPERTDTKKPQIRNIIRGDDKGNWETSSEPAHVLDQKDINKFHSDPGDPSGYEEQDWEFMDPEEEYGDSVDPPQGDNDPLEFGFHYRTRRNYDPKHPFQGFSFRHLKKELPPNIKKKEDFPNLNVLPVATVMPMVTPDSAHDIVQNNLSVDDTRVTMKSLSSSLLGDGAANIREDPLPASDQKDSASDPENIDPDDCTPDGCHTVVVENLPSDPDSLSQLRDFLQSYGKIVGWEELTREGQSHTGTAQVR